MSLPKRVSLSKPNTLCPCESGKSYQACCQPYHLGEVAPDAEKLMRSRYTAYVFKLDDYLLATWHTSTRPATLNLNDEPPLKWLGLQIKRFNTISVSSATVEFIARYKPAGKAERLHEISEFVLENERWFYVSGTHN